jgi:hypothetical protein
MHQNLVEILSTGNKKGMSPLRIMVFPPKSLFSGKWEDEKYLTFPAFHYTVDLKFELV